MEKTIIKTYLGNSFEEGLKTVGANNSSFNIIFTPFSLTKEISVTKPTIGMTIGTHVYVDGEASTSQIGIASYTNPDFYVEQYTDKPDVIFKNLKEFPKEALKHQKKHITFITSSDAFTTNGDDWAKKLRQAFLSANIFGGTAGDQWRFKETKVFNGKTFEPNTFSVLAIASSVKFGMASAHGFTPKSENIKVTKVDGGNIVELNNRNAFEVYKEELNKLGIEYKDDETLRMNELSLKQMDGTYTMRAALKSSPEGHLMMASPIIEGKYVRIANGTSESIEKSVFDVINDAKSKMDTPPSAALLISCAGRVALLPPEREASLAKKHVNTPYLCVTSYGEFCNGFHNISINALLFP